MVSHSRWDMMTEMRSPLYRSAVFLRPSSLEVTGVPEVSVTRCVNEAFLSDRYNIVGDEYISSLFVLH